MYIRSMAHLSIFELYFYDEKFFWKLNYLTEWFSFYCLSLDLDSRFDTGNILYWRILFRSILITDSIIFFKFQRIHVLQLEMLN